LHSHVRMQDNHDSPADDQVFPSDFDAESEMAASTDAEAAASF
jgi:hypothetical protein